MPKFQRVSLLGSEELFRPTKVDAPGDEEGFEPEEEIGPADNLAGRVPAVPPPGPTPVPGLPPAPAPAPLSRDRHLYRMNLNEPQVRMLIDGIQRMKYPHQVRHDQKPSMEEFEALEALRNLLLDVIE
jgi:hypothetical protein